MEIDIYFKPVCTEITDIISSIRQTKLGERITIYREEEQFPDITQFDLALIGVPEERKAFNNQGCSKGIDKIREYLYNLFQGTHKLKMVDLGNIIVGDKINDTYFALRSVLSQLIKEKIVPVIIGGSNDLAYANYLAYESLGKIINIAAVDSFFDLGKDDDYFDSRSYLSQIILHQPNFLFNYTNIGYQTYFVDQEAIDLMQKLYFDIYRLGQVRRNLAEIEPMVRNADMLSFDISAIRHSDAPANNNASPNGFYGEEACQITRYAGLSDKLTSIGFYEYNPSLDHNGQTAHLIAQMVWYFIEGFYNRKHDFPSVEQDNHIKYTVPVEHTIGELVFYKSKKTERWWMEVPCPSDLMDKFGHHHIVPCSYTDYQIACSNQIPERWWQVHYKLL